MTDQELEILFRKYNVKLIYFARKFVTYEDAQDIVVDAFLKIRGIEINDKSDSLLYVMVKNKCMDFIKMKMRRNGWEKVFYDAYVNSVEIKTEFVELYIKKKISELPPQQRKVMELYMEGFTPNDIAKKLGISVDTCRVCKSIFVNSMRQEKSKLLTL